MRAAIYTRISSDPTGNALGVERQEADCRKLADQLGWEVSKVFSDNDTSAYSGKRRHGYEGLLSAIESAEVDALLAWHTDRLHRSPMELEEFIELVDRRRIEIRTVTSGALDLSNSAGRMVARILGSVARQESEHASERRRRANDQRAAAGSWVATKTPFGFTREGKHVPKEAAVIRDGVADVLAGREGLRGVARAWNAAGFRTRTKDREFTATTVRRILLNPRTAGMVVHRKEVVGPGDWEPIIDRDDQLALQAILSDPARVTGLSWERKYIGTKIFECGVCGKPCVGHRSGGRTSYVCPDRHVRRSQAPVDEYVSEVVMDYLEREGVSVVSGDDDSDVAALVVQRDGLQARLDELARLFAQGAIDGSQLTKGTADLRADKAAIEGLLADARVRSPLAGAVNLRAAWEQLAPATKGRLVSDLMRVTILPASRGQRRFQPEFVRIDWRGMHLAK